MIQLGIPIEIERSNARHIAAGPTSFVTTNASTAFLYKNNQRHKTMSILGSGSARPCFLPDGQLQIGIMKEKSESLQIANHILNGVLEPIPEGVSVEEAEPEVGPTDWTLENYDISPNGQHLILHAQGTNGVLTRRSINRDVVTRLVWSLADGTRQKLIKEWPRSRSLSDMRISNSQAAWFSRGLFRMDLTSKSDIQELVGPKNGKLIWSADGQWLAAADHQGLSLYRPEDANPYLHFSDESTLGAIAAHPTLPLFVIARSSGLRFWCAHRPQETTTVQLDVSVSAIAFIKEGAAIAFVSAPRGSVYVVPISSLHCQ